jgi:uncharacterized protein YndB with AHSA1/START domain
MQDRIIKERQFAHPISQIWKAISEQSEISAWFIKADFKAEVGYQYTFTHEDTKITGEVLRVDPVYDLVYTWQVSGTETETTVHWHLTEQGGKTLLRIEHSGIAKYPGELATKFFENFSAGWENCLKELGQHLSTQVYAG